MTLNHHPTSVTQELKDHSVFRLNQGLSHISKCLKLLSEDQVWTRPNTKTNSIANLMLHLCGNVTQYILSSLGEQPDTRERDEEFKAHRTMNKEKLYQKLNQTVVDAGNIIHSLKEEDFLPIRSVQGFKYSGIGIIIHVTEHFSYHTGQIAFCTKLLTEKDLGFYDGLNLNTPNKSGI